jgi:S1-C subfamily serine protease
MLGAADSDPGLRINPDTPLRGRPLEIRGEDVQLADGSGAVKVGFVASEGAFGKAGVKVNDLITGLGSQALSGSRPMADLWRYVQFANGSEQEVPVLRGGEKLKIKVSWAR